MLVIRRLPPHSQLAHRYRLRYEMNLARAPIICAYNIKCTTRRYDVPTKPVCSPLNALTKMPARTALPAACPSNRAPRYLPSEPTPTLTTNPPLPTARTSGIFSHCLAVLRGRSVPCITSPRAKYTSPHHARTRRPRSRSGHFQDKTTSHGPRRCRSSTNPFLASQTPASSPLPRPRHRAPSNAARAWPRARGRAARPPARGGCYAEKCVMACVRRPRALVIGRRGAGA